mmetsp:Transcript_15329/g.31161  ORF Transcript_15329/g.31161 Transcript_15329/m.31161 type:complete len:80 (-) Transcript_15329:110-349(-)
MGRNRGSLPILSSSSVYGCTCKGGFPSGGGGAEELYEWFMVYFGECTAQVVDLAVRAKRRANLKEGIHFGRSNVFNKEG